MNVTQVLQRFDAARNARKPHEVVWRECFDYSYSLRGSGLNGNALDAQQALAKKSNLVDSTSTDAVRILASGIMSALTPANSRWFQLDAGEEDDEGKRWLDKSADKIWKNIHAANFDSAAFESMIDLVCAGWFCMYVDADRVNGGYEFTQWPLSGVYASASRPNGIIDTVYRHYTLTAEQAYSQFGDELSAKTIKLSKDKPAEKVEFIHAVYPRKNDSDVSNRKLAKNLPIASCNIELKEKKCVSESGYHEFPVVLPRWMVIPKCDYGIGVMFDALPDVRMLNELKRMELASADIAIAGMWIAEDDGVLNPRTVKVGARKIIIANSVDSMKALQTGSNFKLSEMMTEQLQRAVRKTLMADQLQPQDGPRMTATEVHVRVDLIRQLLGPVYGRMQPEYLQPLIERCFGIAYRAGVLGEAPESLAGRDFHIKYISPLARAQKLEDVTAIERLSQSIGVIAQYNPEVLDLIDQDAAVRLLGAGLGTPNEVLRKPADVDAVRKQRQEQQQAAQQQQMAMQVQQTAGQEMAKKVIGNV